MKKKNLILFYPSFERGGVEKILENLIQNNKEFKISLISSRSAKKNVNFKKIDFIEVKEIVKIQFIHKRYLYEINGIHLKHFD